MAKFRSNFSQWIKEKPQLRLNLFYQPSEKRSVIGRLMKYDEAEDQVTLYLDDKKSFLVIQVKHIVNMDTLPIYEMVQNWIKENTLLTVRYSQARKGTKTIYGRIIQLEDGTQNLIVYDVDNKMVQNISLGELDDIREENKTLLEKMAKLAKDLEDNKNISTYQPLVEPEPPAPSKPDDSKNQSNAAKPQPDQKSDKSAAEQNAKTAAESASKAAAQAAAQSASKNEGATKPGTEAQKGDQKPTSATQDDRGKSASDIINSKGHLKSAETEDVEIDLSHLSVQEEMIMMINKLTPHDLYPLLPLMRYLVKEAKKRDLKDPKKK